MADDRMRSLVAYIWSRVWAHRLQAGDRIIKVRGWRTALIEDRHGTRSTVTWMFRWYPREWRK